MEYLFDSRDKIQESLTGKHLFIFLDFDGTLSPITDNPKKAYLPEENRKLLKELSETSGYKLAIISGRALNDIKKKIGLKNIIYAGNHGLEIEGPRVKFKTVLPARYQLIISEIKDDLKREVSLLPGVFLEDKGISLSLHYRRAEKKQIPEIKDRFKETLVSYLARGKVKIREGKMVLEVLPCVDWDKARAVQWLLAKRNSGAKKNKFFPIYMGDDATDEDVFKALSNKGLTISVGRLKDSRAGYFVKDTDEAISFLKGLLKEKYAL